MYRSLLVGGLILTLLVAGCSQPSVESHIPAPANEASEKSSQASENVGLVLSDELIREMKRTRRSGDFDDVGLSIGERAVDFTLRDVDRNTVSLRSLLSEKPVVMVFGSFT